MSDIQKSNETSNNSIYESLALRGDISGLDAKIKVEYYRKLCERLGLDPMTQPFLPLKLNGKEVLYASKGATDQLARIHNVNRNISNRERIDDVYVVTAKAQLPNGRTEESIGAVTIGNLKGDALANALMKCESKAKRRVTLSILGLGMLDEGELETIPEQALEVLPRLQIEAENQTTKASTNTQAPLTPHRAKKMREELEKLGFSDVGIDNLVVDALGESFDLEQLTEKEAVEVWRFAKMASKLEAYETDQED